MKKFARFFIGALMAVAALVCVSCDKDDSGAERYKFAGRQWATVTPMEDEGSLFTYIFDFDNQKKGYILLAAEVRMIDDETEETSPELFSLSEESIPMSVIQKLEVTNPEAPYKYRVDVREDLFIKLYLVNKNTMKAAFYSPTAGEEVAFAEFELAPVTEEYDVLNAVWAE